TPRRKVLHRLSLLWRPLLLGCRRATQPCLNLPQCYSDRRWIVRFWIEPGFRPGTISTWSLHPTIVCGPGSCLGRKIAICRIYLKAVQEQLGLQLEATKGQVDALMIDRIERPSAN